MSFFIYTQIVYSSTVLKSKLGFTLIELLIVIAVLGVLAAGVLVAINPIKKINQANDAKIKSNIGQLARAIQSYSTLNNGTYPASLDGIVTSGEIKRIPDPPVTGSYAANYVKSGNEASLYFPLQDKKGYVLCWGSITGQITEVQGVSCTPDGIGITPTPTPDPLAVSQSVDINQGNLDVTGTLTAHPSSPSPSGRFVVGGQRYNVVDLVFDGVEENCCEIKSVQTNFYANASCQPSGPPCNGFFAVPASNVTLAPGQTNNVHLTFTYGPSTPGTSNGNPSVVSGSQITATIEVFTPLNGVNRSSTLTVGTVF